MTLAEDQADRKVPGYGRGAEPSGVCRNCLRPRDDHDADAVGPDGRSLGPNLCAQTYPGGVYGEPAVEPAAGEDAP